MLDKAQLLWGQVDSAASSWDIPIEHSNIPSLHHSIHLGLCVLISQAKLLNKEADDIMMLLPINPLSDIHGIAPKIEFAQKKKDTNNN